jgi:transcriptional regulator GlxA family with amidase domain
VAGLNFPTQRPWTDDAPGKAGPRTTPIADHGATAHIAFAFHHYRHLRKLHEYLLAYPERPPVLAEVAAHVGLSPRRLSRLFQQKTGIRFSRWIRWERVSRAKKLLRDSDAAITEVAIAVGFQSTRSFERAFKNVLGTTASQFRDEIRLRPVPEIDLDR